MYVVDHVAIGHHVPLVGDGNIAAADVCLPQKGGQVLRLQLNEAVAPAAQGGVDGHGPAVPQLSAQQAVDLFFHRSDFRVVAQELEALAVALQLLQHGQDAGLLHGGLQLQEEDELEVPAGGGAGLQLRHIDAQSRPLYVHQSIS